MARKKGSPIEEAAREGFKVGQYKDPQKGLVNKQIQKWKKK